MAGLVLVVGVVVTLVVVLSGGDSGAHPALARGEEEPGDVDGVQTFTGLSADHVEGGVDYPQNPPVGGRHNPVWLNCGVYSSEVPAENAVHSLEHGAVWITYDAALGESEVETLRALYSPGDYIIVSPVQDLPAPVVASAWGKQLGVDEATDPRLVEFLVAYVQGPQTLEPGAACSGGVDETGEPAESGWY
ncbi:uncharacterized protein DUF3105 [Actinorugispora endophytica]|uniref:Uncharacterized protein DUF3105 n=1 Tax=Actinorugispora endophytica TaxID=1605990 RepID=A0A4R6V4R9_9ACTN|nr:uncharacterized protein DUF3105 [Actinorugispora endophytica]